MTDPGRLDQSADEQVRRALRSFADAGPRFDGIDWDRPASPEPRRRAPWLATVALPAAAVLVMVVAGWLVLGRSRSVAPEGPSAASCAGVVSYHGARYLGVDRLQRVPARTMPLDNATRLGCDDGGGKVPDVPIRVERLPGVDPAVAILDDSVVLVREGASVPAEVRRWMVAEPCAAGSPRTVTGVPWSIDPDPGAGTPSVPFTVHVVVTSGAVLPAEFREITLPIQVTASTRPSVDWSSVLENRSRLTLTVGCRGTQWVASAVRKA